MASYANISADQGADFQVSVDIEDANGDPLNLSDYELYGQVRRTYKSENYVDFNITEAANPALGSISIKLSAAQTSTMKAGRYVYDVYAVNAGISQTIKVMEGMLEIVPSVTKDFVG
jgi:hypothetical protein